MGPCKMRGLDELVKTVMKRGDCTLSDLFGVGRGMDVNTFGHDERKPEKTPPPRIFGQKGRPSGMCAGNGMPRHVVCTGSRGRIAPAIARAMHDWRDVFAPKTLNFKFQSGRVPDRSHRPTLHHLRTREPKTRHILVLLSSRCRRATNLGPLNLDLDPQASTRPRIECQSPTHPSTLPVTLRATVPCDPRHNDP